MIPSTPVTRLQKIVLPIIATLLAVALIEGASQLLLRVLGPPEAGGARFRIQDVWEHEGNPFHEPDGELFWKTIPGYSRGRITINQLGFRGPDLNMPKPQETFRIALLGNSVTFGFGLPAQETFAGRLRDRLHRQSFRSPERSAGQVELFNAGVVGYSSWQGRKLYERSVRPCEPDLVVAMFGYNDHHSALESDAEKHSRRHLHSLLGFVQRTAAFRVVWRLSGKRPPRLRNEPVARVDIEGFKENILAIRDAAATDGADCIFMTVPLRPNLPLVENFCAIGFSDQRVWMRQIDFAAGSFPEEPANTIIQHFFRGGDLDAFSDSPENCENARLLSELFPDLPVFHYFLAGCLRRAGMQAQAEKQMRECLRLDSERQEMEGYNDALRELADDSEIGLIDLADSLRARSGKDLFIDVVHPTPTGHDLIARFVADYLISRYGDD